MAHPMTRKGGRSSQIEGGSNIRVRVQLTVDPFPVHLHY